MKVLVTGGAGFIGSHVIRKLKKEGDIPVVLDNLSTGNKNNIPSDIRFIEMDINSKDLPKFIKNEHFDAIIHLAGQTLVNKSIENPINDLRQNILNSVRLMELAKENNIKRIIFSSTAATYGNVNIDDLPLIESHVLRPMSFYGLSKLVVERYLDLYHNIFNIDYIILRFANVYGERQGNGGEGGVISIFAKQLANNKDVVVFGDGLQTRDFIYAGDIAEGIYAALYTKNVNDIYNLSTQKETNLQEIIDILSLIIKNKISVRYKEKREGDIYRSMLSNRKAKKYLNWRPKVDLQTGLSNTINYFIKSIIKN